MSDQRTKMLAGELYLGFDPLLVAERRRARRLLRRLSSAEVDDDAGREAIVRELLGSVGDAPWIEPPFFCDYGSNIHVGARFCANADCVILDPGRVDVGDDVLFGPGVHVYTALHPLDASERATGLESARPVRIGARVWLGGRVVVLPGVTIGDGSVIGAGSVVTRDVPAGVLAVGNPCRVVRGLHGA